MRWRDRVTERALSALPANRQNPQNLGNVCFVGTQIGASPDFRPQHGEKNGEPTTCVPTKPTEPQGAREAELYPAELTSAQEKARRSVLARLEADPAIARAFVSRWEAGDMTITLAVLHVGTCELLIPAERFGADSLTDYDRLAACILNAEGAT